VLSLLKHNILECDYSDGLLPDEALFSLNYEYQRFALDETPFNIVQARRLHCQLHDSSCN